MLLGLDDARWEYTLDMVVGGVGEVRERPEESGWRKVATAVHAMRQSSTPMLLTVVASQMQPLWIDFSTSRYFWESPLSQLPNSPGEVTVYSQAIEPGNPPYPWVSWRPMDPLLWQLGRIAFDTEAADWMRQGDRYALQRWPNLTEIPHSAEEIRMIATLANGYLTGQELSLLTGVDEHAARRVLDTLWLMDAIKTATVPLVPPAVVTGAQPTQAPRQLSKDRAPSFGFFSKLRDRFEGR